MPLSESLRYQRFDRTSDELAGFDRKERPRARIDRHDLACAIRDDDGVQGSIQQRLDRHIGKFGGGSGVKAFLYFASAGGKSAANSNH